MISSNDDTLELRSVTSSYNAQSSKFSWADYTPVSFAYMEVKTEVYRKFTRTYHWTLR